MMLRKGYKKLIHVCAVVLADGVPDVGDQRAYVNGEIDIETTALGSADRKTRDPSREFRLNSYSRRATMASTSASVSTMGLVFMLPPRQPATTRAISSGFMP